MHKLVAVSFTIPCIVALTACSPQHSDKRIAALTPKEMISVCGAFTDAESHRMLNLEHPNIAILTALLPEAIADNEDVISSRRVMKRKGTFSLDPNAPTLTIDIDGSKMTYIGFAPPGLSGCMLVNGTSSNADLTESWFADIDSSDVSSEQ